jgi:two-component system, chemotaxis family, chemotaxis protein CheY
MMNENGDYARHTSVILCDDTDDIRVLLHTEFQMYDDLDIVGEAANGQEAITLADRHHPDVVVLDLAMPKMNGLEALPEIRRVSPESRVIVLSSYDAGSIQDQVLELGACRFIDKSLLPWEIAGVVHEVAGQET